MVEDHVLCTAPVGLALGVTTTVARGARARRRSISTSNNNASIVTKGFDELDRGAVSQRVQRRVGQHQILTNGEDSIPTYAKPERGADSWKRL